MKALHLRKGSAAERQALKWLKKQGLSLEQQNYHCRMGEIDLIMRDGDVLVFVEVRYRSRADFGNAVESVTATKRRKLLLTAEHYLQRLDHTPPCRFDIIGLDGDNRIQWIRNAFQ